MAEEFQYIKLPDGSYGKFQSSATDEQIRAAVQKDFPDAFSPPEVKQAAQASDAAYAQAQQQSTQALAQNQQLQTIANRDNNMTTSGQVLREENNPLTKGLSGTMGELAAGGSEVMGGEGMLQRLLGLARMANAPGVGAGNAVGTTVQNVLANIPGLGGAGGVLPAAGAAGADAITQLLAGPAVGKAAVSTGKAIMQIPSRILAPGVLRQAGKEAIAMELGAPAHTIERVFNTPASKAAYALAESQGPVKTQELTNIVQQAFFKHSDLANPSVQAQRYLSNLEKKFASNPKLSYGDIMDEVQALKARADSALNSTSPEAKILAKTLMDAREAMITVLDDTSTIYRKANSLYRQEQAIIDIMNAVRQGAPGTNLEKLIENSPDVAKAFSPRVIKEISHIANELNDVAPATPTGGFRQFIASVARPLTNMMASDIGRAMLRNSLRTPKDKLPQAITAAVNTWKAMTPKQNE